MAEKAEKRAPSTETQTLWRQNISAPDTEAQNNNNNETKTALLMITELALHVIKYGNKNYKLQACYNMLPGCFRFLNIPSPFDIFFSIFEQVRRSGWFFPWSSTDQSGSLPPSREKPGASALTRLWCIRVQLTSHFSLKCISWKLSLLMFLFFNLTLFVAVGLWLKADSI